LLKNINVPEALRSKVITKLKVLKTSMGLFTRKSPIDSSSESRDWELVANIAQNSLIEQRKSRRWGIFFKLLGFAYVAVLISSYYFGSSLNNASVSVEEAHTAVVYVDGPIGDGEEASANNIVSGLRKAFKSETATAIMLVVNSPGGSPVQAGYIYDEINRLKTLHPDKKVYAVIKELGASAAYYVAVAADEIYSDKASLVGSIGVTASSFGFVDLMGKLGVERRNFTSGEHKSFLDPFAPLKDDEKVFWEDVLSKTHDQFIKVVKEGRGDRLVDNNDLFSGLIWNGEQALELGLIDGLASPGKVARDIIGEENIIDYTPRLSRLEELTRRFGTSMGLGIGKALALFAEQSVQLK
jgi:protease-4